MRKLTAAILMSVIALAAMAQNTVITPYSRYGYGILGDNTRNVYGLSAEMPLLSE